MKTKNLTLVLLAVFLSACAVPATEQAVPTDILQPTFTTPLTTETFLPATLTPLPATKTPIPATVTSIPAGPTHTTAPSRAPILFPSDTPTPFGGSPTPSVPTAYTPDENGVPCAKGPGMEYKQVEVLNSQKGVEIVGKDSDGKWWYLKIPKEMGLYAFCWVQRKRVITGGDLANVPVVEPEASLVTAINIYLAGDYTLKAPCGNKADNPVFNFTGEIVSDGPVKTVKYTWETSAGMKFKQEQTRIRAWDDPAKLKLKLTVPPKAGTYSLTLRTFYPNELAWSVQFIVKCQ